MISVGLYSLTGFAVHVIHISVQCSLRGCFFRLGLLPSLVAFCSFAAGELAAAKMITKLRDLNSFEISIQTDTF